MPGIVAVAAALLLVAAGIAKLRDPRDAADLVSGLLGPRRRLPAAPLGVAVRAGAAAEIVIGTLVIAVGGVLPAALLGVAYLLFAAVAAAALVTGRGRAGCGCFGRTAAPIGTGHVVLDVLAAAAGFAAAARAVGPAGGLAAQDVLHALIGGAQAVLLAALGYLAITALPALRHAALRHAGGVR